MTPPTNTRRVMIQRHHGWEGASAALLAHVFDVTVQHATAICAERCAGCGRPICGCPDHVWSGSELSRAPVASGAQLGGVHDVPASYSRPSIPAGDRDGAGNARAASDVNAATVAGKALVAVKPGNVAPIPQDSLWQPVASC